MASYPSPATHPSPDSYPGEASASDGGGISPPRVESTAQVFEPDVGGIQPEPVASTAQVFAPTVGSSVEPVTTRLVMIL